MKRKMNKTYFKIGFLLLTASLFLYNCQKEDFFTEIESHGTDHIKNYHIERITGKELQQDQNFASVLSKISARFKSGFENVSTDRSVVVGDGLVILDDQIARITGDSTITWTFKVETPTHEGSDIENFMVKKQHEVFSYYLIKYQSNDDNTTLGYTALLEQINGEFLDTSDLDLSSRQGSGNDYFDWDNGEGGGSNFDCEGIPVFDHCNRGGNADGHLPALQLDGVSFCSGSPLLYMDFSHCDDGSNDYNGPGGDQGDPVDGDNPNDANLPPGGSSPGDNDSGDNTNDETVTTLVDPRCPPNSGKVYDPRENRCLCLPGYKENDEGKCILDDCDTSKEDLKKVFPNASDANLSLLANIINTKGKDFGINTKERLQHFLAQAGHETGEFGGGLAVTESFNYTSKARILKIFDGYFSETDTITKRKPDSTYISNPSKLGNYVYCCRMGNGSESSGDGYKYRGRGLFQITGKNNYTAFTTWYNNKYSPNKDFVSNPGLLVSNDTVAIMSALWFYKTEVMDRISSRIDSATTVKTVTKKVNGGKNGLPHRKQLFQRAKDSINCIN